MDKGGSSKTLIIANMNTHVHPATPLSTHDTTRISAVRPLITPALVEHSRAATQSTPAS